MAPRSSASRRLSRLPFQSRVNTGDPRVAATHWDDRSPFCGKRADFPSVESVQLLVKLLGSGMRLWIHISALLPMSLTLGELCSPITLFLNFKVKRVKLTFRVLF